MPQMDTRGRSTAGRAVGTTIKGARVAVRGGSRAGRWAIRNVAFMRTRSGAGEIGMIRLLDLHAASCAGDTLVTMGLATTVFFQAPVGEARSRVALYLFITMVPFAILAPIVGPVLDRFRHGRRYALAVTMLGRAFLAWAISDYLHNFGLFPAAFGVLALSRAYGVARSAAVPRLLAGRSRTVRGGRPCLRLRHARRRRRRADRRHRDQDRPAVATPSGGGDLHCRRRGRATTAAAGRLGSARGPAADLPVARTPVGPGAVRSADPRRAVQRGRAPRGVRLPRAVPGVLDPVT